MGFKPLMKRSQAEWLLDHFRLHSSISGQEAAAMFRIRALPRRIADLEALGHRFRRETKVDTTGQRYVRYHYLGGPVREAA